MQNIKYFFVLFIFFVGVTSCDKNDPIIPEEPELITTLIYTLTPATGGDTIIFTFRDLDGDGGLDPEITTTPLDSGVVYNGEIVLLNEASDPIEDITEEVMEESAEHQFFFQTHQAEMTIVYADMDENSNPLGLQTVLSAGPMSDGHLTVILRHLPDKFANGVSDGDITNAGGETDIEVTFPILIK